MNWDNSLISRLVWSAVFFFFFGLFFVALLFVVLVLDGVFIGVGSGSTSYLEMVAIAERKKDEKRNVKAITT